MNMFCYQCEQTAGGACCTGNAGVCGKTSEVAAAQDELTSALITLGKVVSVKSLTPSANVNRMMLEGMFATLTNVNFDEASIKAQTAAVKDATRELCPEAATCDCAAYDVNTLWRSDNADDKSLRTLVLLGCRGLAAYAYHASVLGQEDADVYAFLYKALSAVQDQGLSADDLTALALEVGAVNLRAMELLDAGNTNAYGTPEPTDVTFEVEPGPFIVVSGHDLHDLYELLQQVQGSGVNVYTHGEMLPAHAYPAFKQFSELKGQFGAAWHNQQNEFNGLPAPVLFTTNCLMPPKGSYAQNVYTTSVVEYPGAVHIGVDKSGRKDFSAVIERAKELGGYDTAQKLTGANGGTKVTTGFAHDAVLGVADVVIDAVKNGALKHIFLIGGCDGARPGRNYYTDFAEATPDDTVILTLGCGKFRLNDLDLGTLGPLPRILDMGQCNDAYSAIKVATALADAFNCDVNELPLTLVISWYEQKAVSILLTLLHLGIKDIILGPTLPAFVSPNILDFLQKTFGIAGTTTPEADMERALA